MVSPRIDKKSFEQISRHVHDQYGINLSESKINLVENRLMKRLRILQIEKFSDYIAHLFSNEGKEERSLLTDLLSTNKTYFYRESFHFNILENVLLNNPASGLYSAWSAACSGGDEAYTIASIMENVSRIKPLKYNVLGTDISSRMIEEANIGKYSLDRIGQLPDHLKKSYFHKTAEENGNHTFQTKDILRQNVRFQKFNLIKDIPSLPLKFDFIFCRNVLIYFKEETKHAVIADLIRKLKPGGYLFLGTCEGMLCRNTNLTQIQPSVFQKQL